jgi:hypothetical protein
LAGSTIVLTATMLPRHSPAGPTNSSTGGERDGTIAGYRTHTL